MGPKMTICLRPQKALDRLCDIPDFSLHYLWLEISIIMFMCKISLSTSWSLFPGVKWTSGRYRTVLVSTLWGNNGSKLPKQTTTVLQLLISPPNIQDLFLKVKLCWVSGTQRSLAGFVLAPAFPGLTCQSNGAAAALGVLETVGSFRDQTVGKPW